MNYEQKHPILQKLDEYFKNTPKEQIDKDWSDILKDTDSEAYYEKKYKQALERARKLHSELCTIVGINIPEEIFPELKEDEDERIRKELIQLISYMHDADPRKKDWIAWLEKQGEFKSSKWAEGDVVRHGGVLALVTNGRKAMKSNCEQITIQYPDEWVKAETKERKYFFEQLEKQGEQPTDKVEPKFKVGDFIMNNDITEDGKPEIFKIIKVCSSWYDVENVYDGRQTIITFSQDYTCHLWTIDDAKDGDVLVDSYSKDSIIILYKGIYKERTILAHCGWNGYNLTVNTNGFGYGGLDNTNYLPATKEQCDLLFAKMKEAGYEWNNEKKELKKIEPKLKVNDWVVSNNDGGVWQIGVRYIGEGQRIYLYNVNNIIMPITLDELNNDYHLWSINDAKNGDILATENFIFIFKNIDDGNGVHYYCQYEINNHEDDNQFNIALPQSLMGRVGNSISHYSPASKKQQDLLFKEIHDAGYTWDSGKKELKKICESKLLDANKVIKWLNDQACLGWIEDIEVDKFIQQFKQDFNL